MILEESNLSLGQGLDQKLEFASNMVVISNQIKRHSVQPRTVCNLVRSDHDDESLTFEAKPIPIAVN
jgi:hypothetical protein